MPHARHKDLDPRSGRRAESSSEQREDLRSDSAALSIFSKGWTKALPINAKNFADSTLERIKAICESRRPDRGAGPAFALNYGLARRFSLPFSSTKEDLWALRQDWSHSSTS